MNINNQAWLELVKHQQQISRSTLLDLFAQDAHRFNNCSIALDDLLLDFSKQHINADTIQLLCDLATECDLATAIQNLFSGAIVNQTEQRPALHTELRNPHTKRSEIKATLQQMASIVDMVQQSDYTDVIVLGIGGSDLGPRLVCEALQPYKQTHLRLHFVANVDADTLLPLLMRLQPEKTICLINSKTFTTIETLTNAKMIKDWLGTNAIERMWGITANPGAAEAFGIKANNILQFWDWVGGRFSVWSAVGLSIAIHIGMENFTRFLNGAHSMDQHFLHTAFKQNIPVLLGLIGIWNINLHNYPALCVQPYTDGLQLLPAYLQQLEMESNGKFVKEYSTAPIIWGGVGCNGQHAYMQMLHQGTQVVPVDFIVARTNHAGSSELQQLLVASCLAQSQALMTGKSDLHSYKECPGNRPSTTIMCDAITPEILGKLIALYEHKVYVQGVIWGIQSFDQWGVQLGKDLIKNLLQAMQQRADILTDSSTAGLLNSFLARSV